MAEEKQRTARKATSMRTGAGAVSSSRTANKARSYREETYRPHDPSKPAPQTIILNTSSLSSNKSRETGKIRTKTTSKSPDKDLHKDIIVRKSSEEGKPGAVSAFISKIKEKYESIFTASSEDTGGSSIKRKQEQRLKRNDLLKKGLIGLIALVAVILIIVLIINSAQLRDVSNINITSTATTQSLTWSGAKKGLSYEIYRKENSGNYQLIDTLTEGESSKTYDNLTSGTLYSYNIVTVNGKGEKTQGATAQAYTKPNSVTRTSAVTTAENTLTANWSLQGGTADYELQYALYDNLRDSTTVRFSSDQAVYNSNSDSYSYTIDNLVTDETYYMSIRTICEDNSSEWCPVFSGTVTKSADISNLDADAPMIALTFDSGPDAGNVTSRILDTLSAYNSHSTFFPTGESAQAHPEMMTRIVNEGHEVGNHTYDNSHVGGEVTSDDIINANVAIEAACGVSPKLFRPTQGEVTDAITDTCRNAGMSVITFNFDSHDWEYFDADMIVERILAYAENGDIIQFRCMDGYEATADAIDVIVPKLVNQGYQLVTVSQLIQSKTGSLPAPGSVYSSAFSE